jgi:6-phosphofructokinase 1
MNGKSEEKARLGILVGGGPAPGINGVIGAATIEAIRSGLEVLGIYDGFKWLAAGDASHVVPLTIGDVSQARLRGGSLLHTSRANPTKKKHEMQNVVKSLKELGIEYLVTIGGDDTAFSASQTCKYAEGSIRVAHVPKTIDNNLPLPGNMPTFGFQTARTVGAELVRNLMEDARTTRRWYVVVLMGRETGHLALGVGNVAGASFTLIPEEFPEGKASIPLVCDIIEGAIVKGKTVGRDYGVAVIGEGIGEIVPKEELEKNPLVVLEYDEHEHPRLAEVPLALILKRELTERAKGRGEKVTFVDVTIGYELRCADPVPFDADYVQQLGWGAVRYLLRVGEESWTEKGAMISVQAGEVVPIPFSDILDPKTGKTTIRRVNINSDQYRAARASMIRLEREDLADERQVEKLAASANLSPEQFRKKFAPVAGEPIAQL